MTAPAPRPALGTITISDGAVAKIAAQSAAEHRDAGAAASRVLGVTLPGAGHLGSRDTDLAARPESSAQIDGDKVFLTLQLSVRWPRSVATVTGEVREQVRTRVSELTGLSVDEVRITVADLAVDTAGAARVC